jgi:hypothetical protein
MVIALPAAIAAPLPIDALLARCIDALATARLPSPAAQRRLLDQLRAAQESALIALPAPAARPFKHFHALGMSSNRTTRSGGYCFMRHADDCNGRWRWMATRVDDSGHAWTTEGFAVVDDFGNLVEVAA